MEKQLLPQLRFPKFDLGYKRVELKKIATFNPKSEELPESFIYIDLESVKNGLLSKEERINKSGAPSRAQRLLRKDDIIYQTVRPYQKNNYFFHKNANDYVASTGYAQIRTKQVSEYLYQYLHTEKFVNKVLVRCTGTSYPAINSTDLSKISINIPNITEQQKIASFLSDVDDKITQLTKKKDLLEQYKKGIMQKIFNQELRFKDDKGDDFPKWEMKKLGVVCDVRDGTHDSPKYVKQGYPLITSKNLNSNGKLDFDDISFINELDYININKRSKVDIGDIIFGMIGTIGNPVLLKEEGFAIKNVALIKEKIDLLNAFLIHYLKSNHILKQFHIENSGGTQKFVALGVIRNLKILIPSIEEQTKIANFLSDIDLKIEAINTKIENSKAFKKGLLQKMFV